jgi:hypothetical protein
MSAANALAKLMAHLPEGRKLQEAPKMVKATIKPNKIKNQLVTITNV